MHGVETAACGRDWKLPCRFEGVAGMAVDAACGQLAGGDAGAADLARRDTRVVLEGMQCERALRSDEQRGKEQAWQ